MRFEKNRLIQIWNEISNEESFIYFPEYDDLFNDIIRKDDKDYVVITREKFQEMTNEIMLSFKEDDKETFQKIVILAFLDNKIFNS